MTTASNHTQAPATTMLEHNLWSMWSQFGRTPGCRLVEEPRITRFETPLARRPYNTVLRFVGDGDADARIDEVLAEYARRGVPVTWIVHPTAQPADLVERLAARGMTDAEPIDGMLARLDRVDTRHSIPSDVVIEEVGRGNLDLYVELVGVRYHLDTGGRAAVSRLARSAGIGELGSSTRAWIARRGNTPLAKATVHAAAGCVGVYGVATRPDARGLGLGRAVTGTALDAAGADGHEICVLHSTPMAVELYRSMGFEHAADFTLVG